MKSRVQHLVPLSQQALTLLKTLRPLSGDSEFLFPSTRNPRRPLHSQALAIALRASGFLSTEVTPHGFRATACTLLNELGWNADARLLATTDTPIVDVALNSGFSSTSRFYAAFRQECGCSPRVYRQEHRLVEPT